VNIKQTGLIFGFTGAFLCIFPVSRAAASVIELRDGSSIVKIDPLSQAGLFTWSVNGINLLPQQWFWFRTGNTAERSIDAMTLDPDSMMTYTLFGDPGPDTASWRYTSPGLSLQMDVSLVDANPTRSLSQVLTWTNTSASPLTLTLFQYVNFHLGSGSNQIDFNDGASLQTGSGYRAETWVTPFDTRLTGFEAAAVPYTRNELNDATSTSFGQSLDSASGDVGAAFEWQAQVPVTGSFQISTIENLTAPETPEPSSAALAIGALAAMFYVRRRRS